MKCDHCERQIGDDESFVRVLVGVAGKPVETPIKWDKAKIVCVDCAEEENLLDTTLEAG